MRTYEMVLILKPQLSDAEIAEFTDKTKKLISASGGEVVSEEKLGRRKLSHPIKHVRDGFYVYTKFKSDAQPLEKLNQQIKVNESVMRVMVMKAREKTLAKTAVKPAVK
ncbi:MAG: 30S ribosomal protein S6 [Elusimicrobia bacterium]|nr:30S ribosomal protein S6 [Elusimicrobiota bacterium]